MPDPAKMREREVADLAIVLDLTPAQVQRLNAFLNPRVPERKPMDAPAATALERAERITVHRLGTLHTFYADLDERQKRIFDALDRLRTAPPGDAMNGRGGPPPVNGTPHRSPGR